MNLILNLVKLLDNNKTDFFDFYITALPSKTLIPGPSRIKVFFIHTDTHPRVHLVLLVF